MKKTRSIVQAVLMLAMSAHHSQAATGSNVNESSVTTTLYASPNGNDGNSGTSEGSPKTLQGAINAAMSQNSKIILLNGDYRQYVNIPDGNTVLVLEAKNRQQAAITGSDVYTSWAGESDGTYSTSWTKNWGLGNENSWGSATRYNVRREMVFVNGARLLQRVDPVTGGPVPLSSLVAGEFTVNDGNGKLYVKMPAGTSVSSATIEIAVRGKEPGFTQDSRPLLRTAHSNLVFRGIVFRHCANYIKYGPALELRGSENEPNTANLPRNFLVQDCLFTQNNGIGFEVNSVRDVTLDNSKFNDNGERGAGATYAGGERTGPTFTSQTIPVASKNILIKDCQFKFNNWRMKGVWGSRNDAAGFKAFGHSLDDLTLLRCDLSSNMALGFWQDYAGSNTIIDSCLIENNFDADGDSYGVLNEMCRGPLTIRNSVIRNNGSAGIISSGTPNVIIENNWIYYNGRKDQYNGQSLYGREIQMNSDTGRDSADFIFTIQGWKINGNRIAGFGNNIGKNAVLWVQEGQPNFPSGRTPQQEFAWFIQSNNNVWSKEINDNYYGDKYLYAVNTSSTSTPDINLATWKNQSNAYGRQDQNSTFQYPLDLSNVPNPLAGGPNPPPSSNLTNRATGGTATASSAPVGGEGPGNAFDGSTGTKWLGNWNNPSWIQYQFPQNKAYTITQIRIASANDVPARDPKNWTLQGSGDGANWVSLAPSQSNQIFNARNTFNANYVVTNTTAYKYYRLNITANNGDGLVQLSEVELLGDSNETGGAPAVVAPIGATIGLRSAITNQFVSTNLSVTDSRLQANYANSVGTWERYRVVDAGNGQIGLLSLNNSKYVSTNLDSGSAVQAGWATSIGSWEKFTWTDAGNGQIALLSAASGKFVSVNVGNSGILGAGTATSIGTSERFTSSTQ